MWKNYLLNIINVCYTQLEEYRFSHQRLPRRQREVNIQLTFSSCREVSPLVLFISSLWRLAVKTFSSAVSDWCGCPLLPGHLASLLSSALRLQRDGDKSRTKCQYPVVEQMSKGFMSGSHAPAGNPGTTETFRTHTRGWNDRGPAQWLVSIMFCSQRLHLVMDVGYRRVVPFHVPHPCLTRLWLSVRNGGNTNPSLFHLFYLQQIQGSGVKDQPRTL